MKNRLVTLAAGLVLLAVAGKFVAVPAIAQAVRAALVRDVDNPARNAVQFELYGYYGSSDYIVPAGKTLVIEDVAFYTPYSSAGTFGIVTTVNGSKWSTIFLPSATPPAGFLPAVAGLAAERHASTLARERESSCRRMGPCPRANWMSAATCSTHRTNGGIYEFAKYSEHFCLGGCDGGVCER